MKYSIIYSKQAEKFLDKLSVKISKQIVNKIKQLPIGDVKLLEGNKSLYRLRVGKYRVVFSKKEDKLLILILQIGSRGDIYKKL